MTTGDAIEIKDALKYSQRTFVIGGVWPQRPNPVFFAAIMCYQTWVLGLSGWAAYDARNNSELLLLDISEWAIILTTALALVIVWFSDSWKPIIDEIRRDIREGVFLRNDEERRLYHGYNNISCKFGKYATAFQCALLLLMFLRPALDLLLHAGDSSATRSYKLPFQGHIFFDYENHTIRYFLLYVYQIPMLYTGMFHIAEVSYVITMVLHVCGKFSVLRSRIRNMPTKPSSLFRDHIKSVVNQHIELRQTSEIMNDNLQLLLLKDYVSCVLRLSLSMYVALTTFETDRMAATNFVMYCVIVISYLYFYSYIGEQLRYESESVGDALYDITWTDASNEDQKLLLTCLINGCQANYLTAGKFYQFSLFGFTKIIKLCMAFLSVLRASMD